MSHTPEMNEQEEIYLLKLQGLMTKKIENIALTYSSALADVNFFHLHFRAATRFFSFCNSFPERLGLTVRSSSSVLLSYTGGLPLLGLNVCRRFCSEFSISASVDYALAKIYI